MLFVAFMFIRGITNYLTYFPLACALKRTSTPGKQQQLQSDFTLENTFSINSCLVPVCVVLPAITEQSFKETR